MRKIYSYETDRWKFVKSANHEYIAWAKTPYEMVFKNCTKYKLMVVREAGSMQWMYLGEGETKTISSDYLVSRFWVNTPNGKFWFDEEGGVIIGRQVRQGFLQNDVVPVLNDGVIEFRHMPKKWMLQKRSIKSFQNPAYQLKVHNCTPYDVIIWLDDDIIDIVKSKWVNTVCLPGGNHMLYFDTKEEEYLHCDKFGICDKFIGPVNGCQMGIIENSLYLEPSWKMIIQKRRRYSGWYEIDESDYGRERMFFWQNFTGPGSIEPYIQHLCASYTTKQKEITIWYNTIDYRLD